VVSCVLMIAVWNTATVLSGLSHSVMNASGITRKMPDASHNDCIVADKEVDPIRESTNQRSAQVAFHSRESKRMQFDRGDRERELFHELGPETSPLLSALPHPCGR